MATLIQRMMFKPTNHIYNIDSFTEFDYMGASEFEYGAIPSAIRWLHEQNQKEYLSTAVMDIVQNGITRKVAVIFSKQHSVCYY